MSDLTRRRFLAGLAASTVAGVGLARLAVGELPRSATGVAAAQPPLEAPPQPPVPLLLPPPPRSARVALPGGGVLNTLPGDDLLALTVDDGTNSEVVAAYIQFAKDTGIRLTFFANGTYDSWKENRPQLAPLVESGQIQLANHTWSHPDLTSLSSDDIAEQITRNHDFLKSTYGVDARPYLRPPYGSHNSAVDSVAADLGYTAITMWSGSLADSTLITEDYIMQMADQYFVPQKIVLGHLNHLPVTHVYSHFVDVIRDRNLRSVTLDDVFV